MIYVPEVNNNYCYVIHDSNTIRAYKTTNLNENNEYIDYYLNSHYIENEGTEIIESTPNCINNITNEIWYRNDLKDILIIFSIMIIFIIGIPIKILFRLFKRFN